MRMECRGMLCRITTAIKYAGIGLGILVAEGAFLVAIGAFNISSPHYSNVVNDTTATVFIPPP